MVFYERAGVISYTMLRHTYDAEKLDIADCRIISRTIFRARLEDLLSFRLNLEIRKLRVSLIFISID